MTALTDREIRMADQIAGTTADTMGYPRANTRFSPGLWLRSLPMAIYSRLLFTLMVAASKLPYSLSRRIALSLPLLVKFYSLMAQSASATNQEK